MENYISINEAVQVTGIKHETIRTWMRQAKFPYYKDGNKVFIHREKLMEQVTTSATMRISEEIQFILDDIRKDNHFKSNSEVIEYLLHEKTTKNKETTAYQ